MILAQHCPGLMVWRISDENSMTWYPFLVNIPIFPIGSGVRKQTMQQQLICGNGPHRSDTELDNVN